MVNKQKTDLGLSGTGLNKKNLKKIIDIIIGQKHSPQAVILFGSRARGDYKENSDIDIAVMSQKWTDRDINLAKGRLEEEVPVPLTFDLVHFDSLKKKRMRENILKEGVLIYESGTD